jgi:ribosome recycling factor
MTEPNLTEYQRRMDGALEALKKEFAGLRTGRASAGMLEPVMVEAYGNTMPLAQVGTISVPEPRMLSVTVWDKGMVKAVEKAIRDANLGLNPISGASDRTVQDRLKVCRGRQGRRPQHPPRRDGRAEESGKR